MKANEFFSMMLDPNELDDLETVVKQNHLSYDTLEVIYSFVLVKEQVPYEMMLKHLHEQDINISPKTFGKYAAALKLLGDISISFEFSTNGYDGRWLVYAPGVVSELCKKRHISLLSFMQMNDLWAEFYTEAELYFDFRQKRVKPPETLTSIKERYKKMVEERGHNGTSHKYVRTALDMVVMEVGDMRKIIARCEHKQ